MPAFYTRYMASLGLTPDASISWNQCMTRMFALAHINLTHNEPVLLVGETGCGKTTVC
jgi:midasin